MCSHESSKQADHQRMYTQNPKLIIQYIEKNSKYVNITTSATSSEYFCNICKQKIFEIPIITGTTFEEYKSKTNEFISDHNKTINNIINRSIYQFFAHYCEVSQKLNKFATYDQIFVIINNSVKDKYNGLIVKYGPQNAADMKHIINYIYEYCEMLIAACVYCATKHQRTGIKMNEKKFKENSTQTQKDGYAHYKKLYDGIRVILYTMQEYNVSVFHNIPQT